MSRNFELMTQLEIDSGAMDNAEPASSDRAAAKEVVPILSSHAGNVRGEEMLRLIQRIFLSANGSAPRQVVLCGVDDENGSSSVCAQAGRTLAANSSRPVCVVDANVRSPRLSGTVRHRRDEPILRPIRSSARPVCEDRRQPLAGRAEHSGR